MLYWRQGGFSCSVNRNAMASKASQFAVIVLFWLAYRTSCLDLPPHSIAKFFSVKHVHSVDAIVCSQKVKADAFKYFTITSREDGYYGLFRAVNHFDYEQCNTEARTGIFIDVSCPSNRQLLMNTTDDKWFTINFIWLIWDEDACIVDFKHALPISTFSEVTVANSSGLFKLSTSVRSLPIELHRVGGWDNSTGELCLQGLNVRINYQQTAVKAAIMFIEDIYNVSQLQQQLQNDTYKPKGDVSNRFMYGNTLNLAYLYNFTLDLVIANYWGDRLPNGTWTGMLGLLQKGEVDITLNPMLPLSRRIDVSYPTVPTLPYWMVIIFKQPRALGTYRAMILELSLSTWACVGATVIIGAIVFAMTQKYEPDPKASFDSDGSFALGVLQSLGIVANQGLSVTPKGTSSRIVCLFLLLVGLLVSNYYSAATMTALLSESPPLIKNLDQLIATEPALTSLDAPYIRNAHARGRVFRNSIIDRMKVDGALTICSLENGVQSIVNGSAFLGEYFVLFNAINTRLQSDTICDLTVLNAGFHSNTMNFMVKNLHFRELHTRGIMRTLEHGLMQKERRKWVDQKMSCSRVTEFIHVQLEAVSVALGVFFLGIFFSFTFLFLEMFTVRRAKRRMIGEPSLLLKCL